MTTINSTRLNLTAAVVMLAALSAQAQERDFGDAPDPYPTLEAHNGARHQQAASFSVLLGTLRDTEPDGIPSPDAEGDDSDRAPNDEDGITFLDPLVPGRTARVRVHVNAPNAAYLDAWIDFNRNGQWTAPEKIFNSLFLPAGVHHLRFPVPRSGATGDSYARFRLSSEGGLSPVGLAPSGEVEDYRVSITRTSTLSNDRITIRHDDSVPGRVSLTWNSPSSMLQFAPEPQGPWTIDPEADGQAVYSTEAGRGFFRTIESPDINRWNFDMGGLSLLVRDADLILDGTVVDVAYRNSEATAPGDVSVPHTFVTFAVNEALKGLVDGPTICLRFAGGLAPDGAVLITSRTTLFDPGERSFLFVRLNGFRASPLANGPLGRYRVVGNTVYGADGSEVLVDQDNRFVFGARQDLAEVRTNQVGQNLYELIHQHDQGEEPDSPPPTGQLVTPEVFKARVTALLQSTGENQQPPVFMPSIDISEPFRVPNPIPGPRLQDNAP